MALPGDAGTVLVRVDSGAGEPHWAVTDRDLSLHSGDDYPHYPLPVDVTTPEPGRLKVTMQSAEDGKSTPAMVRLLWKTDGRDRKPADAVDFVTLEGLGYPIGCSPGRHVANVPGRLAGPYWCVAGGFDMVLPPGEWEITIRRGLEHTVVFDRFRVESGGIVAKVYRLRRWVDMPKLGWYSGDDHVRSWMTSDLEARQLLTWAHAEDIHVANILKMGDIYRTWFEQCGFGENYQVLSGHHVLAPGQECPRTLQLGHTVSLNTRRMVRDTDKHFLYDYLFDTVRSENGLCGYAHVHVNGANVARDTSINVPKGKIDFVEVLQPGYQGVVELGVDLYYEFLDLGFKLTVSAGSDVPWGGTMGEARMYAYVGDRGFSPDNWFESVRRGRTFVTNGPMIEFRVDKAFPGDEIVLGKSPRLRVQARAWGDGEQRIPAKLEIVSLGEVIRSAEPAAGKDAKQLVLDFEVDVGEGFWIAARATGNDGSRAHTTPVYVIRQPLRFWKLDAVEDRIARRLKNLDEVEKLVAEAIQKARENKASDHTAYLLVRQGSELLRSVAEARSIYSALRLTAERERGLRRAIREGVSTASSPGR